jgi:phage-related protein
MPLPTFNPLVKPSPGTGHTPEISLRKAAFGDGYTQASPSGINHIRQVIQLKWDGIDTTTMQSLRSFFEERGGYKAFYYTPYGFSTALKWTCEEWSGQADTPWSFTAKLKQSFTAEV